jgi:hypothetical protein
MGAAIIGERGLELTTKGLVVTRRHKKRPAKRKIHERVDTESDTTAKDCNLARIVTAWPNLPATIRRAMLALLGCTAS